MSHMAVIVLSNYTDLDKAREEIEVLLRPYDENAAMPRYKDYLSESERASKISQCVEVYDTATTAGTLFPGTERERRVYQPTIENRGDPEPPSPRQMMGYRPTDNASDEELRAFDEGWDAAVQAHEAWRESLNALYTDQEVATAYNAYWTQHDPDGLGGENLLVDDVGIYTWSTYNAQRKWDYWTIGGRYTGRLDPDYDPTEDPRNYETCRFCEGTGTVTARVGQLYPAYLAHVGKLCYQCDGKGKALKFHFVEHDRDARPVSELDIDSLTAWAVVTPDGTWYENSQMGWFGMGSEPSESDEAWYARLRGLIREHPEATAIIVDCHI